MSGSHLIDRRHPAHGVIHLPNQPTVVLVTVCTEHRQPWLGTDAMQTLLRDVWTEARGWLVGPYLLMPEHLHFFTTPGEMDISLEKWMRYWKRDFSLRLGNKDMRFQPNHWDTRMRSGQHYRERWNYVQMNPVRRGLVTQPEEWPHKGVLFEWIWMEL